MNTDVQEINYPLLLTDIIQKQILVLGPVFPLLLVADIKGLKVSENGTVTEVSHDPRQITRELISKFLNASGEVTRQTIMPILLKEAGKTFTDEIPQMSEQSINEVKE